MTKQAASEPVIETSTIRLSAEETRLIMKASIALKPLSAYHCSGLVEMGIMKRIPARPDAQVKALQEQRWEALRAAAAKSNGEGVSACLAKINELDRERQNQVCVLTDLGKQIARGITVRLGAQYKTRI